MLELSDEEKTGLKILALIRDGQLNMFKCSMCSDDMQEQRNCTGEDTQESVYYHPEVGEFFACPLRFIPNSVYDFIDRLDCYDRFVTTQPNSYEEMNPRFWASVKFYENFKYELDKQKHEQKSDSNDAKSKMAALFK